MSTRTTLRPNTVLNASMASSQTSTPTILQSISVVSYAITWAGTSPVGTVSVQVSNDYALDPNGGVANAGTWNLLPLTVLQSGSTSTETAIPIAGNTGQGFIDVDITGAYAVRLIYTAVSGTGTILAVVSGKVQ